MKGFYNFIRITFGWIVRLIYPIKVIGDKKLIPKEGKVVLISNHLSYRDIPVIVVNFPGYRHFLAKKEFTKNKLVKWFFTKMGAFFVDRDHMDISAIRKGVDYLKNGEGIALFPEGTRNRQDSQLQQIKGGAAMFAIKGEAPLIPVIFQRKARAFRRTLVYVGEPIDLSDFYGKRLSSPQLEEASKLIERSMEAGKVKVDTLALDKGKGAKS